MEFEYTLNQEEYLDYCKFQILAEPTFKKLRHRCWFILPIGAVLLLIAFFPAPWWAYVIAVALSVVWVLVVNKLVARMMIKSAQQRQEQVGEEAYKPLKVELKNDKVRINGSQRTLQDYRFFSTLILLALTDGSVVILPQRVFGESKEDFRRVVDELDKCLKK